MSKVTFLATYVSIIVVVFLVWSFWPRDKPENENSKTLILKQSSSPQQVLHENTEPPLTSIVQTMPEAPSEPLKEPALTNPLYDNENTALATAAFFLDNNNLGGYTNLRQQWKGRENEISSWLFMDAAERILAGQRQAAIDILTSQPLTGRDETERLIRLAALNVVEAPERSWGYLVEAAAKDPSNPDLRIFKASLLEAADKKDMALKEYVSAIQKDPADPYLKEQLADFYLRIGQYPYAMEVLQDALKEPSLDSIWLKATLWSLLISPFDISENNRDIPEGELKPLVAYILSLPPGIYWNEEAFLRLPEAENYLKTRQETFWLRVLSALKKGNESEALHLLNNHPFQDSLWAPQLSKSLITILSYRLAPKPSQNTTGAFYPNINISNGQEFLNTLSELADQPKSIESLPPNLQQLLLSKEIFAAAFLANGWEEAGIQFHAVPTMPQSFPNWIAYALTQALRNNRSDNAALEFAKVQTPTPELTLLIAEITLASGQRQDAFNIFLKMYKNKDEIGSKAALLIAPLFLDQSNTKAAKEAILDQPDLANNIQAREILARAFLKEGEQETAYRLYLSIENYSSEAKSYLVRKAFMDRDWPRAKQLTEELIENYPQHAILKDNLRKIIAEMNRN